MEKCFVALTPPWKQGVWGLVHSGLQDWPGRPMWVQVAIPTTKQPQCHWIFHSVSRAIWAENNQQGKKTCNFVVSITLNIIIIKGLQSPVLWNSGVPFLSQNQCSFTGWVQGGRSISGGWTSLCTMEFLGVSLGHAEMRSSIPSSQLSPSLPRGFLSSWAQSSSAVILNAFHLTEQAEAVQAGRTSTLLLVIPDKLSTAQPAYLVSCCRIHFQRVDKTCLHCWNNIQLLIVTFSLLYPVVWLPEFSLLPNPPSHQLTQLWNSLEVTLHFAV